MCPERPRRRSPGFALMAALFIIVTLAAIGAYLLTLSTGQTAAISQDEQATRAYQAARAGIDWGAYQVLVASSCAASQNIALKQGLDGFWVLVQCTQVGTEIEGGATIDVFRIVATGCNRSDCTATYTDPMYVNRQLQLTLAR